MLWLIFCIRLIYYVMYSYRQHAAPKGHQSSEEYDCPACSIAERGRDLHRHRPQRSQTPWQLSQPLAAPQTHRRRPCRCQPPSQLSKPLAALWLQRQSLLKLQNQRPLTVSQALMVRTISFL